MAVQLHPGMPSLLPGLHLVSASPSLADGHDDFRSFIAASPQSDPAIPPSSVKGTNGKIQAVAFDVKSCPLLSGTSSTLATYLDSWLPAIHRKEEYVNKPSHHKRQEMTATYISFPPQASLYRMMNHGMKTSAYAGHDVLVQLAPTTVYPAEGWQPLLRFLVSARIWRSLPATDAFYIQ